MPLAVDILVVLAAFQIKHLLIDFTGLQTPWMYLNKGNPRHLGGYVHAGMHVAGTLIALVFASYATDNFPHMYKPLAESAYGIAVLKCIGVEFVWHWITDMVKTDLVKVKGWKADKHPAFWTALGVDQFSHQFCYLVMVAILIKPLL